MVPDTFRDFFVASAGAGAALVGLLFVAVSIAPEKTVMAGAPVERQTIAASAYTALLNAFFISLAALIPQTALGLVTLVLSLLGLWNCLILTWNLLRRSHGKWQSVVRKVLWTLAGLALYGYELYNAILLLFSPKATAAVYAIAGVLLGIYALGLARAWQLLGGRNYHLGDFLTPLRDTEIEQATPTADPANGRD
jgi:hypothetical protein